MVEKDMKITHYQMDTMRKNHLGRPEEKALIETLKIVHLVKID
jgi:hypothetical protein